MSEEQIPERNDAERVPFRPSDLAYLRKRCKELADAVLREIILARDWMRQYDERQDAIWDATVRIKKLEDACHLVDLVFERMSSDDLGDDEHVAWSAVRRALANKSRDRKTDAYMPASELLRWLKLAVQRMQDAGIEFNHVNFQHVIGRAERALAAKETT